MTSVIAIDLGASNFRVYRAILNERIELEQIFKSPTPKISHQGFERWDIRQIVSTLRQQINNQTNYESVAVCGWGVDFCLLNDNGELIENPITYRDPSHQSAFGLCNSFSKYEKTGIQPWPFNTLCQLQARQLRNDSELQQAESIMMIPDFVSKELANSNEIFAEITNASTTQMLNLEDNWDNLDLPIKMPEIRKPGHNLRNGVQLCASHDTASAFYSVASADVIISSGTWSLLGKNLDRPINSQKAFETKFTNERGVNGFRFLKNISGFWLFQQCFGNLNGYELEEMAALSQESCVFDVNHPSLLSPQDMKFAIKSLCDRKHMSDADLVNSIYESLLKAYLDTINDLNEITKTKAEKVTVIGGGVHHRKLIKKLSNQLDCPFEIGSDEATILGNARLQFKTLGLLPESVD